jgi:hypothetical protein
VRRLPCLCHVSIDDLQCKHRSHPGPCWNPSKRPSPGARSTYNTLYPRMPDKVMPCQEAILKGEPDACLVRGRLDQGGCPAGTTNRSPGSVIVSADLDAMAVSGPSSRSALICRSARRPTKPTLREIGRSVRSGAQRPADSVPGGDDASAWLGRRSIAVFPDDGASARAAAQASCQGPPRSARTAVGGLTREKPAFAEFAMQSGKPLRLRFRLRQARTRSSPELEIGSPDCSRPQLRIL